MTAKQKLEMQIERNGIGSLTKDGNHIQTEKGYFPWPSIDAIHSMLWASKYPVRANYWDELAKAETPLPAFLDCAEALSTALDMELKRTKHP